VVETNAALITDDEDSAAGEITDDESLVRL
jgi:hypothetical protein